MLNTLGWCYAEIGSAERARTHNERAAVLAREIGDPEILGNAAINLALNHLDLGDPEQAAAHLVPIEEGLSVEGDPWMRWRYRLHALNARGRITFASGEAERTLILADEECAGARRHRVPKVEARALVSRGQALLTLERRDEAEASLRAALEVAGRIGYQRALWQAHAGLAEIARRCGQTDRAGAHEATARALVEKAAATLADGRSAARAHRDGRSLSHAVGLDAAMLAALERVLPGRVSTRPADLKVAGHDASSQPPSTPDVVVWPLATDDVVAVVRLCADARVPLTARGGGSSLEGNPIPVRGGVVLDLHADGRRGGDPSGRPAGRRAAGRGLRRPQSGAPSRTDCSSRRRPAAAPTGRRSAAWSPTTPADSTR